MKDVLIHFSDEQLEPVASHKFLGVVFQEHPSWSAHVAKIQTYLKNDRRILQTKGSITTLIKI